MPSQRCIESERRCVTSCAVDPDADGDGVDAIECGGADCDDTNPARYPGATEVCDPLGVDEDCNLATFGDRDADRDAFVDALCCNGDACGTDCDDRRADTRPGMVEVCDGRDNDCDGMVDEDLLVMGYADEDLDLHGDPMAPRLACPGAARFSTVGDDCDDANPARHGAQLELCDGIDNDCDGVVDDSPVSVPWYPDDDGDGFGAADPVRVTVSCAPLPGFALRAGDCDDTDRDVNPGARERCNGRDDDCNGIPDFRTDGAPPRGGDGEDDDGDGVADRVCGGADCDDARADVRPGAPELCDGVDNDCDGVADGATADARWYLDRDGDGFGDAADATPLVQCAPAPGRVTRAGDCDDGDATIHPARPDPCGRGDENCDGVVDEHGPLVPVFRDVDRDGFGDARTMRFVCPPPPPGFVARPGDADDTNPARHPTAPEVCNGVDDDLDGLIDEDLATAFYRDADGDGFGDAAAAAPVMGCTPPAPTGWAPNADDCDDARAAASPGAPEVCNGRDDDCDGVIDDGAAATCTVFGATPACVAGVCAIASCMAGRADCNDAASDGCETQVTASASHCGACGNACRAGDTCGRSMPGMCDASPIVALRGSGDSNFGPFFAALRATGGLVTWGSNPYGNLGRSGGEGAPQPVALADVAQVSLGNHHGCAVTRAGRVYCWGLGDEGVLGNGSAASRASPVEVTGITDAVQVAAGDAVTCAVLRTGRVKCWGRFRADNVRYYLPQDVPVIDDAVAVSVGNIFACALRERAPGVREVWCWGQDERVGACGLAGCADIPRQVEGLPTDLVAFSHGWALGTCVITGGGAALCWGHQRDLGLGVCPGGFCAFPSPASPAGLSSGVLEVALGVGHGCAVRRTGSDARELWCWGDSDAVAMAGAYGNGPQPTASRVPVRAADGLADLRAVAVGCTGSRGATCILRADGRVTCFGSHTGPAADALGHGACPSPRTDPTRPEAPLCGIP
jgi:alpha-tubulin suppressor-like RCC1 family protein